MRLELPYIRSASLVLLLWGVSLCSLAQEKGQVTFYKDIQPIIYQNCAPCHQPGKAGPFSLITYEDVRNKADFIVYVTSTRYMPPWQADHTYQTYLNERRLTDDEITKIQAWVSQGKLEGDKKNAKSIEISQGPYPERAPDYSFTMQKPFTVSNSGKDDYRFFNIPTNLTEDTYLEAIEFIPGNKRLVHHSRVMTDTSHMVRNIEGLSANDSAIWQFNKYPPLDRFLYGWVPGNFPIFFPKGSGKKINKDVDLILNIHYAPSSVEEEDLSTINLYLAKGEIEKEVKTITVTEEFIVNRQFFIPKNTKPYFEAVYPIESNIEVIAVNPHMHYLGANFKAFAVTPDKKEIPLIKIDKWDFNWQTTYQFKELVEIPKGSLLTVQATFDNTAGNPANPTFPPKDVTYGWNTTSEMLNLILYYLEK
ncbi:MAG: cytochrome c [Imperialibacter sp.]|uniref:c-type cytochrome n=1 Tax=Imperialibacter sp. TaxID=2038411 RepID=UPI0032EEA876